MPIGVYPRGKFSLSEFFWLRVAKGNPSICWQWRGASYGNGYGEARGHYAHRVSWELNRGPIPSGRQVLHKCDNPQCVNPDHLYLGDDANNRRDAIDRCRYPGGAKSSRARLTATQVAQIKREASSKYAHLSRRQAAIQLAKKLPVSHYAVCDILAGNRWAHVAPQT